jgi:hypothetical protein
MIVVRTVIQAEFSKGHEIAANMAQALPVIMKELGQSHKWRVMTDLSGPFDTVILEVDANDLAEWEATRPKLFASKAFGENMARTQGLSVSGHNEFYTVEAEG